MEDKSLNTRPFGEPIEMPLPLLGNCPDISCIFDPAESKKPQHYTGSLITFIEESVYEKIIEHANSDTRNEVGGAVLGKYCIDRAANQRFILITDAFFATPEINENFSSHSLMRFTHTFFRKLDEYMDEINQKDPDIIRLGMYHSHPGYTVFMSSTDVATFRGIFFEPWQISFIIDPLNNDVGVFYWEDRGKSGREISSKTGITIFKFKSLEDTQIEHDLNSEGSKSLQDDSDIQNDSYTNEG